MPATQLHTVAVYPRGNYRLRVLIEEIECAAEQAPDIARDMVFDCISALHSAPICDWHARVVATHEVEDIPFNHQPET